MELFSVKFDKEIQKLKLAATQKEQLGIIIAKNIFKKINIKLITDNQSTAKSLWKKGYIKNKTFRAEFEKLGKNNLKIKKNYFFFSLNFTISTSLFSP